MSPAKRRLIITLVTLLLVALVPSAVIAAGGTFTDDDTSAFEADIEWLAGAGVTSGCNPPDFTEFCPNDSVKRGQMAAFMRRFAAFLGAEDGVVSEADSAAEADNAGTVDDKNAIDFQPALFAFASEDNISVSGPETKDVVDASVTTTDLLGCFIGTFERSDILVRASGYIGNLGPTEAAKLHLTANGTEIDGTTRIINGAPNSFAMEWLFKGSGGTEDFALVVDEVTSDSFNVIDAVITVEVVQDTQCEFLVITLDDPAEETTE